MIFNNKKANVFGAAVFVIFFLAVWAFWLGPYVQDQGQANVASNGLTGIEAFFWLNLNFVIAIIFLIAIFIFFSQ